MTTTVGPVELPVLGRIGAEAGREQVIAHLTEGARLIRRKDVSVVAGAGMGHIGGEFSLIDVLATLYLHVANIGPANLDDPERDRVVLSKGHVACALYCTLAAAGIIPAADLDTFMKPESRLNGHPNRMYVPGVEANTGPLGHGFPIAVGTAIAGKLDGSARRTFVLLGDGELQEGTNWEAMMCAGQYRLERLVALVDRNRLQQGATVAETADLEPLADKARAFGWEVIEVDGHDHGQLLDAFAGVPAASGKPTFVIAHTHKGHPISFMSDNVAWHHKVPDPAQVAQILAELEARP